MSSTIKRRVSDHTNTAARVVSGSGGCPGAMVLGRKELGSIAMPPPAAAPQPVKSSKGKTALIVGATLGGLVALLGVISAIGSASEKNDTASTAVPVPSVPTISPPRASAAPVPLGDIGQEVHDGKFAFVITSVDSSKVAGDPTNRHMQVTAQGVFVNIHLRITNIGDRPQSFSATDQQLWSVRGQQFNADTMAAASTGAANVDINPGNSIDATVSFDVPPQTQLATVELHDSASSAGVRVYLQQGADGADGAPG
jgi:Domain of unknown function (DUF4352)